MAAGVLDLRSNEVKENKSDLFYANALKMSKFFYREMGNSETPSYADNDRTPEQYVLFYKSCNSLNFIIDHYFNSDLKSDLVFKLISPVKAICASILIHVSI